MKRFKSFVENFQDGRNPEDKGDMGRLGLRGKTLAQLKTIRSSETASPRAKQLAHWRINMVRGRMKRLKDKQHYSKRKHRNIED